MNEFIIFTSVLLGIVSLGVFVYSAASKSKNSDSRVGAWWAVIGAILYTAAIAILPLIGDGITPTIRASEEVGGGGGGEVGRGLTAAFLVCALIIFVVSLIMTHTTSSSWYGRRRNWDHIDRIYVRAEYVRYTVSFIIVFIVTGWAWSSLFTM